MKPRIVTGSPFPRIMDSLVFPHSVVTSVRLNVRRAEGDTKGIIFLCFAICFLSYEAIIYDADHHNFEFPPTIPQNIWQLFFSLSLVPYLARTRVIHPTA